MKDEARALKRSRTMYIIEAALEYLVSLSVTGAFLATLTKSLDISDALTAIISAITSLGCLFQIMSVSFRRRKVKPLVVILSITNQLLFAFLYVIPFVSLTPEAKTVIFVTFIILAYAIYNFAHPKKIAWLMSLVDDDKRGRFTANKEIISLISGMVFSYVMGAVIDSFTEKGDTKTAFITTAATIFVLMIGHTVTLLLSVEKTDDGVKSAMPKKNLKDSFASVFREKAILKVSAVYILYQITSHVSISFFGTFVINELGMKLSLVSAIAILGSVSRIIISPIFGKYADKHSFASLIEKCFLIFAASLLCMVFANGSIGVIMYIIYTLLQGIAMGGINSSLMNMVFDYAPADKRADALVVSQSASGVAGFLTTLGTSFIFDKLQSSLEGSGIYAQQILSAVGFVIIILATVYVRVAIIKRERERKLYSEHNN